MSQIMIKDSKLTKSEQHQKWYKFWSKVKKLLKSKQWQKCCKFWSKVKKILILFRSWLNFRKTCQDSQKITSVQNLKNIQNVTNYDQRSKSYKIWTITKKLQVLMKGKKLQILNNAKNLHILIKGQQVTKSEQCLKCCKFW